MQTADPALEGRGVSLRISGIDILRDISFSVAPGELVAVIGPNGAGKTSLINVLNGITRPTTGSVQLHGQTITSWSPHRRARAGIGRTFQTSNLLLGRSLLENVRLAATAGESSRRSLFRAVTASHPDGLTAHDMLALVGLAGNAHQRASALSHGDRRKLELAIVLAQNSSVILLDEPMAGVNAEDVSGLVDLIRAVHRERGRTILMVEHHMHVVMDLAERIAVLHHGALLAIDAPRAIIDNPVVQSAYVGEPL